MLADYVPDGVTKALSQCFVQALDTVLHITGCSNYCSHYLRLSCGAATPVQVVRKHAKEFLKEMNCKVIATQLRALELIPESVEIEIQSKCKEEANAHVLNHLKEDADEETVREVFRIASEKAGYGRMNIFAADILRELQ